jgi:hypothetical protein
MWGHLFSAFLSMLPVGARAQELCCMALKRLIRSPDQAHTMDTLLHLASSSTQLPQLRRPSPSACWSLWPCGRGLRLPRSGAATPPAAVCTSAVRCFSGTNKLSWGSRARFCSPWCSSGVFRWPADCAPTSTSAANPILHFSWIPDINSPTNPTLRIFTIRTTWKREMRQINSMA